MGEQLHSIINNEEWRKEKLDFICSVVENVDQDSLLAELHYCETNEDAEGLMQSLIMLQDRNLGEQNNIPPHQHHLHHVNNHDPFPIHNDIIVRLPEEQIEEQQPVAPQPQESLQDPQEDSLQEGGDDDNDRNDEAESSDSDDSCYFTPNIFNSSQTEQNEADDEPEIINNIDVGADEREHADIVHNYETQTVEAETFNEELAQAIAESNEAAQAEAKISEAEGRIMSQVSILASLFSDADPDFLQERIEQCMKLEGDEERFQEFVEANLELKTYPKMKDYLKRQKQAHRTQYESAEDFEIIEDSEVLAENLTIECGICLEENILGINTSTCSAYKNEHTYCNQCIKRYAEAQIGQGLTYFKCMEGYCSAEFSLRMLKKLLDPAVFTKLWERRQQEEIAASGLENLETCPFCPYMVSMPNQDDKIFQCMNPDCLIDSCRLCKEPSHIPLRCDEIEKKGQTNARTYLENEMAEAMIRECPKCRKRFIIEAGCNRMTCPCGAVMCYICKKLIETVNGDGYSHFERGQLPTEKCPLYSDATTLHAQEVRVAAERARQGLDPQVTLVHDPTHDY